MILTVVGILAVLALLLTLWHAASNPVRWTPLWVAVLLLSIIELLQVLPLK